MNHFFDVGANIGQTFAQFLIPNGYDYEKWIVWCFEPSPRHQVELLKKAQELSQFTIKICPFGLSNRSEWIRFFEKDMPLGDSFDENNYSTKNLETGYEIFAPVFGISDFICRMTAPDDTIHLKIDAEGAEYKILTDLEQEHSASARERIKRLWVEFHDCDSDNKYGSRDEHRSKCEELGLTIVNWI